MRIKITVLVLLLTLVGGLILWQITDAASTATVSATVTATNLDLSVSSGSITYGSVALNTATTTAGNGYTQTVTNNGSTMKLNAKSSDASGGTAWTLGTSPGSNIFKHEVSTTSGSTYMTFQATDTYLTASTSIAASLTQVMDFRLTTPTASSDFVQKTITLTVQAAAP
ncbi:MAG: hypothetical protein HY481_00510 [Candidatus Vogelbacteria bacterium]|nr:hypothetical protein [Candidatus Vogelbacteria bacterium]